MLPSSRLLACCLFTFAAASPCAVLAGGFPHASAPPRAGVARPAFKPAQNVRVQAASPQQAAPHAATSPTLRGAGSSVTVNNFRRTPVYPLRVVSQGAGFPQFRDEPRFPAYPHGGARVVQAQERGGYSHFGRRGLGIAAYGVPALAYAERPLEYAYAEAPLDAVRAEPVYETYREPARDACRRPAVHFLTAQHSRRALPQVIYGIEPPCGPSGALVSPRSNPVRAAY